MSSLSLLFSLYSMSVPNCTIYFTYYLIYYLFPPVKCKPCESSDIFILFSTLSLTPRTMFGISRSSINVCEWMNYCCASYCEELRKYLLLHYRNHYRIEMYYNFRRWMPNSFDSYFITKVLSELILRYCFQNTKYNYYSLLI